MENNLIKINVNNVDILCKKNITIIQACLNSNLNIDLPRFCFHEKLSIAGNCRMCLVEVVKSPKPVVACAMQVMDGMVVKTNTNLVKKAREGVLEFLLANHPLDCPICDQGGECDLQDQSMIFGGDMGRFYEYKRSVEDKDCGPLIKTVMTRCIHCTRCVRFLNEVAGIRTLGVVGRGNKMEIGTYLEKVLNTELSGNIIDLCPVGALTSKPYAFNARSWELISKDSVDIIDSMSPDIKVDMRGVEIMRILPRLNEVINENWISDITRFHYDSVVRQRLLMPNIKISNNLTKSNWKTVLNNLWYFFYINNFILSKNIKFSYKGGELSDAQSLFMLKEFNNFFGIVNNNSDIIVNNDLRQNYLVKFKKVELLKSNLVILVGTNLRLESPLMNLRLRKLFLKKKIFITSFGSTVNLTYNVKHLGLNIKNFINFVEGKSYFCNFFLRSNNPVVFVGNNNSNNFFNVLNLLMFLKNNYKSDLSYGVINKDIGVITSNELNAINNNNLNYNLNNNLYTKNVNFEYLLNNYSLNNLNSFSVFQGHHWDNNLVNTNIILPSTLSFEKNSNYLSLEGINRQLNVILPKEKNVKIDWQIILAIMIKYNKMLSSLKVNNLNKFYFSNYINIINLNKLNNNSLLLILNLLIFNNSNISLNSPVISNLINNYLNFYFNDIIYNNNLNNLGALSPVFLKSNRLYNNINNFNLLYNFNKIKLNNTNFNSNVNSIYKNNILTNLSKILSITHNKFKSFDTNYIYIN